MKPLLIFGLMIGLFLSACASNPAPAAPSQAAAMPAPNPLTVRASTDTAQSNSAVITIQGGSLSATSADGTQFTLTLPKDALLQDTKITLTPVTAVEGLPLSGGLVAAVQLEPDGLELLRPGTLTMELPKPLPSNDLLTVGFTYAGNGQEFHLNPSSIQGQTITQTLYHFSGKGSGQGTKTDVKNQQTKHPPTQADKRLLQDIIDKVEKEYQEQKNFLDSSLSLEVLPKINEAVKAERAGAPDADALLAEALHSLLVITDFIDNSKFAGDLRKEFQNKIDEAWRLIVQAMKYEIDDAHKKCVEKDDIEQFLRIQWMLVWLYSLPKYAGDVSTYDAKGDECGHHFFLEIKETTTGSIQDVIYEGSGKYKLPIALQRGGTFTGEATGEDTWTVTASNCNLVGQSSFQVQTTGRLDTGAHVLNTKINIGSKVLTATATCGGISGSATNSIPGIAPEFNIPSHTGTPVKITSAIPGGSWEIGGTLIANR